PRTVDDLLSVHMRYFDPPLAAVEQPACEAGTGRIIRLDFGQRLVEVLNLVITQKPAGPAVCRLGALLHGAGQWIIEIVVALGPVDEGRVQLVAHLIRSGPAGGASSGLDGLFDVIEQIDEVRPLKIIDAPAAEPGTYPP